MPSINLRDKRNRDALVRAEGVGQSAKVNYVDKDGNPTRSRKVLKSTSEHALDRLVAQVGSDDAKLAAALVAGDPDVDIERIGMFLTDTSRVFVNANGDIVYQIEQIEVLRTPRGQEKERRPRRQPEPNVESEIPINWTGRLVKKEDAVRRFMFSSKLQIVHVNGLTYDFLFGMAKELAETNSLMLLGAGASGKEPLIFRRGSTPHRGFLEGRVNGDTYVLLLHLSKLELKRPVVVEAVSEVAAAAVQPVADVAMSMPAPVAAPPVLVPTAMVPPTPAPAQEAPARKPSVGEVLAAVGDPAPSTAAPAKQELAETVAAAKTSKRRDVADAMRAGAMSEGSATVDAASDGGAKATAKKRASRAKPTADKPA